MDRIAFRLRGHYFSSFESEVEVVEVLVNDAPLAFLWSEAGGPIAVPISRDELGSGADHLWGRNPSDGGALVEDGRVAVLNCACGFFPCGGGTARLTFDRDTVTWSEFSVANSRQRVELGPFEFARNEYEGRLALIDV